MPDNINVSMIGDSVVAAIKESVETKLVQLGDRTYTTRPVFTPPATLRPDVLIAHTLTGLVDYVNNIAKIDPFVATEIKCIHVVSPERVNVCGPLNGWESTRFTYLSAQCEELDNRIGFQFGQFCEPEAFTIALQSLFEETEHALKVMRLVGNMRAEAVKTLEDDGVTQVVAARAGVVLKTEAPVPNPVNLAPFRTFNEISQPVSAYVFRVRENGDKLPLCALFCADGDAWKLTAIKSIRDYLAEKITSVPIIA